MRTLAEVRPLIREMLAIHEALRKLGFMPEEIFVLGYAAEPGEQGATVGIAVLAQGRRCDFPMERLHPAEPFDRFLAEWNAAAALVCDRSRVTEAELDELYTGSDVFKKQIRFLARLHMHGFRWPKELQ